MPSGRWKGSVKRRSIRTARSVLASVRQVRYVVRCPCEWDREQPAKRWAGREVGRHPDRAPPLLPARLSSLQGASTGTWFRRSTPRRQARLAAR
eukprot:5083419-Pleurochrysis_carterae.AAC.4